MKNLLIVMLAVLLIGSSCTKEKLLPPGNEGNERELLQEKGELAVYTEAEIKSTEWTVVGRYGRYDLEKYQFKLKSGNKIVIIRNAQEHIFVLPNYQKGKPMSGNVAWMLFIL